MVLDRLSKFIVGKLAQRGILEATAVQRLGIPLMMENKRIMVQAETGCGKTGVFLWPLMTKLERASRDSRIGVIVPSRELGAQIHAEAIDLCDQNRPEEKVVLLRKEGHGDKDELSAQTNLLLCNNPNVIIGTPKWMMSVLTELQKHQPKRNAFEFESIVVDEADKVLKPLSKYATRKKKKSREIHGNSGENLVKRVLEANPRAQLSLFSATANSQLKSMCHVEGWNVEFHRVGNSFRIPTNIQHYYAVSSGNLVHDVKKALDVLKPEACLCVINTSVSLDSFSKELRELYGVDVVHLNRELNKGDAKRRDLLNCIQKRPGSILLASDEICRGLDFKKLSHVIIAGAPRDASMYLHLAGRTGRQGRHGVSLAIVEKHYVYKLKRYSQTTGIQFNLHPNLATGGKKSTPDVVDHSTQLKEPYDHEAAARERGKEKF
ncbi:hypothetical protein AAMO2058_000986100 [Amorphochlora amoebiformis]